jgi:hypothetical protein
MPVFQVAIPTSMVIMGALNVFPVPASMKFSQERK